MKNQSKVEVIAGRSQPKKPSDRRREEQRQCDEPMITPAEIGKTGLWMSRPNL